MYQTNLNNQPKKYKRTANQAAVGEVSKITYLVNAELNVLNNFHSIMRLMMKVNTSSKSEQLSMLLSLLSVTLPKSTYDISQFCSRLGYELIIPTSTDLAKLVPPFLMEIDVSSSNEILSVLFSITTLFLFKRVTKESVSIFWTKRLDTINTMLGTKKFVPWGELNVDAVMALMDHMPLFHGIRKKIISFINTNLSSDKLPSWRRFLVWTDNLIQYSGIGHIRSIIENITDVGHPCLTMTEVLPETKTMLILITCMKNIELPAYAPYLLDTTQQKLLSRRNYPLLIWCAKEIMMEKQVSAKNMRSITPPGDFVRSFRELHYSFKKKNPAAIAEKVNKNAVIGMVIPDEDAEYSDVEDTVQPSRPTKKRARNPSPDVGAEDFENDA